MKLAIWEGGGGGELEPDVGAYTHHSLVNQTYHRTCQKEEGDGTDTGQRGGGGGGEASTRPRRGSIIRRDSRGPRLHRVSGWVLAVLSRLVSEREGCIGVRVGGKHEQGISPFGEKYIENT